VIAISAIASVFVLAATGFLGASAGQRVQASAEAQPTSQPVLVELFTSEGCSSCPPADALLAQLDAMQGTGGTPPVIVLSEHVTYWDDLGWHDPYSAQAFTDRQNQYSSRFGLSGVYTPQAVVDGSIELVGSDRAKLVKALQTQSAKPKIPLTLANAQWSGNAITAQVSAASEVPSSTLVAVLADDSDQSSVQHGENQGRNLRHVAVARTLTEVRKVKGPLSQQPIQIKLPSGVSAQGKMRLVVFLADSRNGHVLGATMQTLQR
jgi:hypothetical protein